MPTSPPRSFARPAPVPAREPGLGRGASWTLGAVAAAAFCWAGATTWYIVFRDEFAQSFLARQAEMKVTYEDRIIDLRNRLEREITAGLVERNGFGSRVEALVRRQSDIEARQSWLAGLADRAGIAPTPPRAAVGAEPVRPGLPIQTFPSEPPAYTGSILPAKPMPQPAEPLDLRLRAQGGGDGTSSPGPADRLSALEGSLRRASEDAITSTEYFRRLTRERSASIRAALAGTRLPLPPGPAREKAMGGPLIPAPAAFDAAAFAPIAADAEEAVSDLERLHEAAAAMPIGRPLSGELEQTSAFGYRLDPFTRGSALHSGIDFRAAQGAPVRATSAGRVVSAEYSGGYGNMVEVEHEGGVSTRYGHLSAFTVTPGQRVEAGQIVGRAGSTGRSTGTHLHYETRIDGEAVNPTRFLEAGRLLAAAIR